MIVMDLLLRKRKKAKKNCRANERQKKMRITIKPII